MTTHRPHQPATARRRGLLVALLGLVPVLTAAACSSDDGSLTPEELCGLVSPAEVASLIEIDDVTAEAGPSSAPGACVYSFTSPSALGGTATIYVSVLSKSRTGGSSGSEALAHVASEAGASNADPLRGVDAENFTTTGGPGPMVAAVDAHGRVATLLLDSDLTADQQAAVTNAVLDALAERD